MICIVVVFLWLESKGYQIFTIFNLYKAQDHKNGVQVLETLAQDVNFNEQTESFVIWLSARHFDNEFATFAFLWQKATEPRRRTSQSTVPLRALS